MSASVSQLPTHNILPYIVDGGQPVRTTRKGEQPLEAQRDGILKNWPDSSIMRKEMATQTDEKGRSKFHQLGSIEPYESQKKIKWTVMMVNTIGLS